MSLIQSDLDGVITCHWNSHAPVLRRPVPAREPARKVGWSLAEWWQGVSWEPRFWAYPEYCVNDAVARALRGLYRLAIVTDRPPSLAHETRDLVERAGLEGEIFFTELGRSAAYRKLKVAQALKPDLILEDDRHQANFLGEAGLRVILLDRPNNQGPVPDLVMRIDERNLPAILRVELWEGVFVGGETPAPA